MIYQSFAYLYDELMNEAPYGEWMDFFKQKQSLYAPNANSVLDLACGTGEITIRLQEAGFNVTGVDLSEDMLTVAQQKASEKGLLFHYSNKI
jgi:2-polyprenyl-3-methyl-5-hydroxy-6-metoxy-1,4-benzoquinol methylase